MQARNEIKTSSRDVYDIWVIIVRICSVLIVSALVIGWTLSYFLIFKGFENNNPSQQEIDFMFHIGPLIGNTFLLITIPLVLSIFAVIWRLRVRQHRLGLDASFGSEVKALLIILAFFSFSFLTRFILDTFFSEDILGDSLLKHCKDAQDYDMYCTPYKLIVWVTLTQYAYDMIPMAAIYVFHYFNFKEQNAK